MRVQVPPEQLAVVRAALEQAGTNETGGQLFGRQIAPSEFVVTEVTVQRRVGSFARFIVDVVQSAQDALRFFARTGHRYTVFNYLGEWHSHPSFEVVPSGTDRRSMKEIVSDPAYRGTFAILLIVRLDSSFVTCGGWLFDPAGNEEPITIDTPDEQAESANSD